MVSSHPRHRTGASRCRMVPGMRGGCGQGAALKEVPQCGGKALFPAVYPQHGMW